MKILFIYPTRSRRYNFLRGIDSIKKNLSNHKDCHVLITVDDDDEKMHPLPVLDGLNYSYVTGKSESKVHAINRGLDQVPENFKDWSVLICMSDDMTFIERGFDSTIKESFKKYSQPFDLGGEVVYRWDMNQFIHFPDGNRSDLCTMSIIGRDYYERDGYIYNPEYKSLFCDDEAQQVAKIRGCYKYVDKQIFKHLHPAYGLAIFDEQYQKTEAIGNTVDRETFIRRKEANFGL